MVAAETTETTEPAAPAAAVDLAAVEPVVLYDGVCGLCSRSVRWILRHERDHALKFAPLQGETTAALRARYPEIPATLESVVFISGGKAYLRSKAFLYLARHLRAPWRWSYAFRWFPGFILDLFYRVVAATRYRIFGKTDTCELPAPDQRARFLP
jgi:predicted DCC family thiol-disulfide oxidoreductase YuxK